MNQKEFTLLYFSFLGEAKGVPEEKRVWEEGLTTRRLFETIKKELSLDHLSEKHVRVSVNHAFVDFDTPISCGDVVAFIPPVAGG